MNDWIKKILEFERKYGSGQGTGLSLDVAIEDKWKKKYPEIFKNGVTEDAAIEFIKKEYLPKVKGYPEEVQKRLVDYAFNSGRDIEDLLLFAHGDISLNQIQGAGPYDSEWEKNKGDIIKAMKSPDFINKLDQAKHNLYQDYWQRKGSPNTYNLTSSKRVDMWSNDDVFNTQPNTPYTPQPLQRTTQPTGQSSPQQTDEQDDAFNVLNNAMGVGNNKKEMAQDGTSKTAKLLRDRYEEYADLRFKAMSDDPETRRDAEIALIEFKEEVDNLDAIAKMDEFFLQQAMTSGAFDEAGRLKLETDVEAYQQAKKSMADDFAMSALELAASAGQVIKGLGDLGKLTMPAQPQLPQDSPELTQALGMAQRDAEMIDPRLNEARKKAALMTLNQFEEISKTASAGQAGAFGANMQQAVNRTADALRKGAYEDQLLKQRAQQMYYNLASQKAQEDRFQYGAEERRFGREYDEFNRQRNAANLLAQTGFTNLFGALQGAQSNADLMQLYQQGMAQGQRRLDRLDQREQQRVQPTAPDFANDPNVMAPPPEPEMYIPDELLSQYEIPDEDVMQALMQPLGRSSFNV